MVIIVEKEVQNLAEYLFLYNSEICYYDEYGTCDFSDNDILAKEVANIKDIEIYILFRRFPYMRLIMKYENGFLIEPFGYSMWHICTKILS